MCSLTAFARMALAAAILLLASACGDEDGNTADDPAGDDPTSQSPSATEGTGLPACSDVWVAGAKLPRSYRGCDQDGAAVKADKHPCSYGAAIIEYDDRFYAVTGKYINEVPSLKESEQFHQALSACQG